MATAEQIKTDLVTLEIDGREVQAPKGSMIIEASDGMGIDIPRFCYHRKLSIAANCRMCLVDVEKAPKPLPACATPVAEGMKVFTQSRRALDAQRGVMEFLLINHPLDCPVCDQGGECELQDLAIGYGRSVSRFTERKRVVKDKNLGPLVATDMTRCIHCTRCVRFLDEIAGSAELGGVGRGEHMEISTFVERNINSELSGNVIDVCPVGALTDKPFRFSARAWEMMARPYIGSHDCVGSNLYYHTYRGRIMRAVPKDNEAVNECWLPDRDRYSHIGLNAGDRLTAPRVKIDGEWRETDWETALNAARDALAGTGSDHGGDQLGFLISPRATSEEHYLFQKLAHALGSDNVDHRLGVADFSDPRIGRARLDRPTAKWSESDAIFLVGSNLRQEQPILGHRVRTAWRKHAAKIADLNPIAFDFNFDLATRLVVPPQHMVESLARVARAALDLTSGKAPGGELGRLVSEREPEPDARLIAEILRDADSGMLVLGDIALNHSQAAWLRKLAEFIAETLEVALNVLPGPANSEGAWRAGAVPLDGGLHARAMLEEPRKGYLLWDFEPDFDLASPARSVAALEQADTVVAATAFAGSALSEVADVLLPLAPVPETDGSYVNADGLKQEFAAAIKTRGEAREGWKILRMLGAMLDAEGFDFTRLEAVSASIETSRVPAAPDDLPAPELTHEHACFRVGDLPWTASDALVRRSEPLQQSAHGDNHWVMLHPATADELTVATAEQVAVSQGGERAELPLKLDRRVPPGAVWVRSATCSARVLDGAYGPIKVERA